MIAECEREQVVKANCLPRSFENKLYAGTPSKVIDKES